MAVATAVVPVVPVGTTRTGTTGTTAVRALDDIIGFDIERARKLGVRTYRTWAALARACTAWPQPRQGKGREGAASTAVAHMQADATHL